MPPLNVDDSVSSSVSLKKTLVPQGSEAAGTETKTGENYISMKLSVVIGVVELCLHYGTATDASLATLQVLN